MCATTREKCASVVRTVCAVFTPVVCKKIAIASKRNTSDKKLRCLSESVAFAPLSNLDCALFLGVVRAILLNRRFANQVVEDEEDDACEPYIP